MVQETEAERRERLERERDMLAEARADVVAGRCLDHGETDVFLDALVRVDASLSKDEPSAAR